MDIKKAHEQVLKKAAKDAAFRKALLADATAAIEKELGVKAPAGVKVKAIEDSPALVHLVLPPAPTKELSDKDLGAVAGGACAENTACGAATQNAYCYRANTA